MCNVAEKKKQPNMNDMNIMKWLLEHNYKVIREWSSITQ